MTNQELLKIILTNRNIDIKNLEDIEVDSLILFLSKFLKLCPNAITIDKSTFTKKSDAAYLCYSRMDNCIRYSRDRWGVSIVKRDIISYKLFLQLTKLRNENCNLLELYHSIKKLKNDK